MQHYSTPKKMKKVGDLFEKYKIHFKAPQATVEKACSEAIFKVTGFKVSSDLITYTVSTKTLSMQIPSVLKSELRFHYQSIFKELKNILGETGSPETIL